MDHGVLGSAEIMTVHSAQAQLGPVQEVCSSKPGSSDFRSIFGPLWFSSSTTKRHPHKHHQMEHP